MIFPNKYNSRGLFFFYFFSHLEALLESEYVTDAERRFLGIFF